MLDFFFFLAKKKISVREIIERVRENKDLIVAVASTFLNSRAYTRTPRDPGAPIIRSLRMSSAPPSLTADIRHSVTLPIPSLIPIFFYALPRT